MGSNTRRVPAIVARLGGALVLAAGLAVAVPVGVTPAGATSVPVGVQKAELLPAAGQPSTTDYGWRTAISGDGTTAVIGDGGGTVSDDVPAQGAVWVFRQSSGTWESTGTVITGPSPVQYDYFGDSVAVNADGTVLVVGADGRDGLIGYDWGAAYVYRWNSGTSQWGLEQTLLGSDSQAGDYFGESVAMSKDGTTILVGAFRHTVSGVDNAGAGYVFHYESGTWTQKAELTGATPAAREEIGDGAAIDAAGDTAVLSTWNDNLYVWRLANGTWGTSQTLTDDTPGAGPWLGGDNGLAISDNGLTIVGGSSEETGTPGAGFVFTRNENGSSWQRAALPTPAGVTDEYGYAVAVNGAGTRVVVGDWNADQYGLAYVFDYDSGSSSWNLYARAADANRTSSADEFGVSVSMSTNGATFLVGDDKNKAWVDGFGTADVPSAPTSPNATLDGATGAIITWNAPASDGGSPLLDYRITASPTITPQLAWPETTATLSGLAASTTYTFSIVAENLAGASSPATTGQVTTPTPTAPSAPTASIGGVGNASVTVEWTAPSSDGGSAITGYNVYKGDSAGGENYTSAAATKGAADTSATIGSLTPGTTYYFTVKAVNNIGESSASNEVFATAVGPPGAPSNVVADVQTSGHGKTATKTVTLTWTDGTTGGAAITDHSVEVYSFKKGKGGGSYTQVGSVLVTGDSSTSYTVPGTAFPAGGLYAFKVAATNSVVTGEFSGYSNAIRY